MGNFVVVLMGLFQAHASCPSGVTLDGELTCSSTISDVIVHTDPSQFGGECNDGACYTCGDPHTDEKQLGAEKVYSFTCQRSGEVALRITDLPCDLDIYVLDDSCDPYEGCVYGSTAAYAVDDAVDFLCEAGRTYYITVEAYGTEHLDVASGKCTVDGTATGEIFDPTFTLSFDVSEGTGCAEDCDNGLDDDLDGDSDCADSDCGADPVCCDKDGDGDWASECGGDDCDDTDPLRGPSAVDVPGDGIDQDCDGSDAEEPPPEDTGLDEVDTGLPVDTGDRDDWAWPDSEKELGPDGNKLCGCASTTPAGAWAWALGLVALLGARRR